MKKIFLIQICISIFQCSISQAPTISSFSPSSGSIGTLVSITGTNLNNPTLFTIGGVNAIVISNDGNTLVGMVMPGATTGAISITTGSGNISSSGNFTVTQTPYPSLQQGGKLVGSGTVGTPVFFGRSVAVSADGNTAIIGGYGDNNNQGAAWVYIRSGNTWIQQGNKLVGTGNTGAAGQGHCVAISADGNTAIVGGGYDNNMQGAVWIFIRTGNTWSQQGNKLVGSGGTAFGRQGHSVSISADGNTAIVGGYIDNSNQGAAWIFTRSAGNWVQQGNKLVGTGSSGNSQQGISVSISADGNTAIVGGWTDNYGLGATWVFTRTDGVWTQQGNKLVGTGSAGYQTNQGYFVGLSADGNTAIIGGYYDDNLFGAFWIFTRSGGNWTQQGNKMTGTGNAGMAYQGVSVALSADGNTAIVGALADNNLIGAIWVFTRSGNTWTQQGNKLTGSGNTGGSAQGTSVAISADGKTVLVGALYDNSNQGAAWVFVPCMAATKPTLSSSSLVNCGTQNTTLSIVTGTLNNSASWQWYSSSAGGTPAGSGTSINVSPTATTTYYVRGEGGCNTFGSYDSIIVKVEQPITSGTYPNFTITSGANTTIIPNSPPTNAASMVAFTSSNFTGLFSVNPTTGIVTITNAKPAGIYPVTVKATNSCGEVTTTFTLTVTDPLCSQSLFTNASDVSVGVNPNSVAIGDFNNDGNQDIATANYASNTGNIVSINLGNGTGGFGATTNLSTGAGPVFVAAGEFNGDGNQDLAVVNHGSKSVSIFLGNGTGSFVANDTIKAGNSPITLALGDFNGDGKQDIITGATFNTNYVSLSLGNGSGSFSDTTNFIVGLTPISVVTADFNGDGKLDFATANFSSNTVSIMLGNGSGGFSNSLDIPVGTHPNFIVTGDFNRDGKQDIATTNEVSNDVSILLGDGIGGMSTGTNISFVAALSSISTGDFNGDGNQDFAISNVTAGSIMLRLGDGAGHFSGNLSFPVGAIPRLIAIGDFDNDGKEDMAIANNGSGTVSVRMGGINEINLQGNSISISDGDITPSTTDNTDFGNLSCSGAFNIVKTFAVQNTGTTALQLNSGAITVSGTDAALFSISGITLPVSLAAGASTTFSVTFTPTSSGTKTATIHINNNDCDEADYDFAIKATVIPSDLTIGSYANSPIISGGNIVISPNTVPANATRMSAFTNPVFSGLFSVNPTTGVVSITNAKPAGIYPVTVKATNSCGEVTTTFTLTVTDPLCSQGLFTNPTHINVGINPGSVAIGDFNNDGKQDFASSNFLSNDVSIRFGDGLGGFSGSTEISAGASPASVTIGDFNGDGIQDLAIANYINAGTVSIRLGDGTGGFSGSYQVPVGQYPMQVAVGDFNGDGKKDLATANKISNNVSIRLGDGTGDFTGTTNVNVGLAPVSLAIGDLNGDGQQDIAAANYSSNNVSISLGDGAGNFSGSTEISAGSGPYSIAIGDFNKDGKPDFATANNLSNNLSIRLGNGLGGFSEQSNVDVGINPRSVAIGDFNGDGKQDIAIANYGSLSVSIRLGDGAGNFSGNTNISLPYPPWNIAIGDFNGDHLADFAVINFNASNNKVSIGLGGANEINLEGNSISIPDGDTTPISSDNTDFGNKNIGDSHAHTFSIQNKGTTPLSVAGINITGSNMDQFAISGISFPASIAANSSANFMVTFTPTSIGIKTATLVITNNDCDEATYNFDIWGQGNCIATNALAVHLDSNLYRIYPGSNSISAGAPCRLMIGINSAATGNEISGLVTTKVWVENNQPTHNGRPYVKRHYEITPATNAAAATGTITLYFLQSEFDAFNAFPYNGPDLPAAPYDLEGIYNLRVIKYSGVSMDGSGTPGSYNGTTTKIDPEDDKIIWNSEFSRWEVTFNVTGFSGFFVTNDQNNILSLASISLEASLQNNDAHLFWKTNNAAQTKYELQRSNDGNFYQSIFEQKGIAVTNYYDHSLSNGTYYYRIKATSDNSNIIYSNVAVLKIGGTAVEVSFYPNPATKGSNLQISTANAIIKGLKLMDATGKILMIKNELNICGSYQLQLPEYLSAGVYYVLLFTDKGLQRQQVIIQ